MNQYLKDQLYSQIDGVCMGGSLGPLYANAFLCFYEQIWLENCPVDFKPRYYKRYVDDTFLVFDHPSHVQLFLDYLNSKHPNIKFTKEMEVDSKLSFLDILVTRNENHFITSVYRKPTFTGLGMNFLSFSPKLFKINSMKTLINRAYNICSDYVSFDIELKFLYNFFTKNSYPTFLFYSTLRNFLNNKFEPKLISPTVPRDLKYLKLPYMGHLSFTIRNKLKAALRDAYPQINFQFVFTNNFNIGSFLKHKTVLPYNLCSMVVYSFTCPRCNARYVGSTTRWLSHRISEHEGVSIRTRQPLSSPSHSAIRDHAKRCKHHITHTDFTVLKRCSDQLDLIISESLFIQRMNPQLNIATTAVPLYTI